MKIKLTSIQVDDQEKALHFYTDVLGFVKKTDVTQGPYRWLTVASPEDRGHRAAAGAQRWAVIGSATAAALVLGGAPYRVPRLPARDRFRVQLPPALLTVS